ncbi:MAG: hypothetical protein HYT85_05695 [candidate division NC10 bacterium]|nr:hypothetical protein [candidate division NC10 bacterium]
MTPLFNPADLVLAAPEIVITVTGLLVLVLDLAVRGRNRGWLGALSVLGVIVALGLVVRQAGRWASWSARRPRRRGRSPSAACTWWTTTPTSSRWCSC